MQKNKCQIQNHEQGRVHNICFDTQCKLNRVCCQICLIELHRDHCDKLSDTEYILNYLKTQSDQPDDAKLSQILKELTQVVTSLEELQKFVNQQIDRLRQQSLKQVCKGLVSKYHILEDQGQALENQIWNQLALDMLKDFQVQNGKIIRQESLITQQRSDFQQFMNQFLQAIIKIDNKFKLMNEIFEQKDNNINFEDFTESPVLTGHTDIVRGIDICKQRNLLASGSCDKTVKLWSLVDNSCLKTYEYSGEVYDVVFSNQGNLLAFAGEGDYSVKLIDISDLKKDQIIFEFKGHTSYIYRLAFSNDSKYLISGSDDKKIIIWDIIQKKESFQLSLENYAYGVAISGDDTLIASNSYSGGQVNIWSFQNKKLLCSQKAHSYGSGVEFSRDQKMLVSSGCGSEGMIKLWSLDQLNQSKLLSIREFKTANNTIWTVLFSPCDRFIMSMCNQDREIKVIDSQTGEVVKLFKSRATNGYCLVQAAISKDMDIIAYGEDKNIAVWRLK